MGEPKNTFWEKVMKSIFHKVVDLGGTEADMLSLPEDRVRLHAIGRIIVESLKVFPDFNHGLPPGWRAITFEPSRDFHFEDVEFFSPAEVGEDSFPLQVLWVRASMLGGSLGRDDGKDLCRDKRLQDLGGKRIFLAGTIIRDPTGSLHVPCIEIDDKGCRLGQHPFSSLLLNSEDTLFARFKDKS